MLRSGWAFSARIPSSRRSVSRAACDMLWLAAASATRSGASPLVDVRGCCDLPPARAMTGEPVNPWKSIVTVVSRRTGVLAVNHDGGMHLPRIGGVQVETRHLSHSNTIEKNG